MLGSPRSGGKVWEALNREIGKLGENRRPTLRSAGLCATMSPRWKNTCGAAPASLRRERRLRRLYSVSLIKRGNIWHFAFMYNRRRYRGSCKTSNQRTAEKIEAIMLARVMEDGKLPGSTRVPTLADFSERFLAWLTALPTDRSQHASLRYGQRRYCGPNPRNVAGAVRVHKPGRRSEQEEIGRRVEREWGDEPSLLASC